MSQQTATVRAQAFCDAFNVRVPILMAPMAGACPASLAIAVANAGGLGGCGALLMQPDAIRKWAADVRSNSNGGFQFNLWIPDPPAKRDAAAEAAVRRFLGEWGPEVPAAAGDATPPDFYAQCEAMLEAGPAIISSIMGLYPDRFVARLKDKGIRWFATATTVGEAKAAEAAGADVIIAQGMEAGGHRGAFEASKAEATMVGLFSLLPAVVDAVKVPVVATGGIADGRSLTTAYVQAAAGPTAPPPAPYPVQRGLTAAMRDAAQKQNDIDRIQAWAGQSAGLARAEPAGEVVRRIWAEALVLLGQNAIASH